MADERWKRGEQRVVVPGIEHGLSGYTNYGCRCEVCTTANTDHHRDYRARRFGAAPTCVIPGCPRLQSRAYGNSLCYKHARERLQSDRREVEILISRSEPELSNEHVTSSSGRSTANRHGYESAYYRYLAGGRTSVPSSERWGLDRAEAAAIRDACDEFADRLLEAGVGIICGRRLNTDPPAPVER